MGEIAGGITLDQVAGLVAQQVGALNIPTMATAAPPGVADSSAAGAASMQYAGANHTHASKARKQRVTGVSTATYTWVYPTPFPAGVVPIVPSPCIEDPANSSTDIYNAQISGTPTNTQCVIRITRQSSGLLSLLLGALSINPTPGTINLHCVALEP